MPWRRRPITGALLVIVAALVLAGCLPAADPWSPPRTQGADNVHLVGVIGDSLVFEAQHGSVLESTHHYLTDSLTELGFFAATSAMIGAKTTDLAEADNAGFGGFPAPGADIQIIGLGTNDAHDNAVPVATYERNLRSYIDARSPHTCFGLITIYTGATSWGLDVTAPAYNAALRRIAADHEHVHVIDWDALARAHPSFFNDPTQPHGNAVGQAAYRLMITLAAALLRVGLDRN